MDGMAEGLADGFAEASPATGAEESPATGAEESPATGAEESPATGWAEGPGVTGETGVAPPPVTMVVPLQAPEKQPCFSVYCWVAPVNVWVNCEAMPQKSSLEATMVPAALCRRSSVSPELVPHTLIVSVAPALTVMVTSTVAEPLVENGGYELGMRGGGTAEVGCLVGREVDGGGAT